MVAFVTSCATSQRVMLAGQRSAGGTSMVASVYRRAAPAYGACGCASGSSCSLATATPLGTHDVPRIAKLRGGTPRRARSARLSYALTVAAARQRLQPCSAVLSSSEGMLLQNRISANGMDERRRSARLEHMHACQRLQLDRRLPRSPELLHPGGIRLPRQQATQPAPAVGCKRLVHRLGHARRA